MVHALIRDVDHFRAHCPNIYTVLGVDSNVCTIGGNSIRETGHNLSKGSPHWGTADSLKDIRVKFNFGSINET